MVTRLISSLWDINKAQRNLRVQDAVWLFKAFWRVVAGGLAGKTSTTTACQGCRAKQGAIESIYYICISDDFDVDDMHVANDSGAGNQIHSGGASMRHEIVIRITIEVEPVIKPQASPPP